MNNETASDSTLQLHFHNDSVYVNQFLGCICCATYGNLLLPQNEKKIATLYFTI